MGTSRSILGQAFGITGGAVLYTVPDAVNDTVVSVLTICNQTATTPAYSIAVIPKGGNQSDALHWVHLLTPMISRETSSALRGVTLASGDFIWVVASANVTISFSLFGQENAYR